MSRIETKVTASAASAAAVTVIVFLAGLLGVEVPAEVAAAAVTLVAGAAGWLAPHTPRSGGADCPSPDSTERAG